MAPPKKASTTVGPEHDVSRLSIAIPPWVNWVVFNMKAKAMPQGQNESVGNRLELAKISDAIHRREENCWGIPGLTE
jgi:hypothetical protein